MPLTKEGLEQFGHVYKIILFQPHKLQPLLVWITQNFTANYTDADNVGGTGIEKSFYQ